MRTMARVGKVVAANLDCRARPEREVNERLLQLGSYSKAAGRTPATVSRKREAYEPHGPTLICGWKYAVANAPPFEGYVDYWIQVDFVPTFSPRIQDCEAGKDHWVGELDVLRSGGAGPVVKGADPYPVGCSDWDTMKALFDVSPMYFKSNAG